MRNQDILFEAEVHEVSDMSKSSKITLSYQHRIFEINQITKMLVGLIKEHTPNDIIAAKLSKQFNYKLTEEEIVSIKNRLVENMTTTQHSQLDSIKFKLQILRPEWVQIITKPLVLFYDKYLFIFIQVLFLISVTYTLPNFFKSDFLIHLTDKFNAITFLKANILLLAIVLFHELGHATACRKFNVENGAIGFGLYFVTPVFYSDTTKAWKLKNTQRLVIDFGGIYFQAIILIPLSYYYYLTKDLLTGYLIFLNYIIILSNLNPLIKYDGYWIVSDLFDISNMRQKTTQLLANFTKSIFLGKGISKCSIKIYSKKVRLFIITYTVVANIFFLYFFCWLLPGIIASLSIQLTNDVVRLQLFMDSSDTFLRKEFFNFVFTIFLNSFILFSLTRIIYLLLKKIYTFLKTIYDERYKGKASILLEIH